MFTFEGIFARGKTEEGEKKSFMLGSAAAMLFTGVMGDTHVVMT